MLKTPLHSRNARLAFGGVLVFFSLACGARDDGREARSAAYGPLLIAPMLEAPNFCQAAVDDPAVSGDDDAAFLCASKKVTGGSRISEALQGIGPKVSPSGQYELGYTLVVPLFRYFRPRNGRWTVDTTTLKANLSVISEVDRRVVVYLSSNHFTDAGLELSAELARDSRNLMWSANGPLAPDDYFNHPVIAWTLSDQGAPITRMRKQVFGAALDAICALPEASRSRIAAVSVLGEVHDLFPNFTQGPGFNVPAKDGTDYSPLAIRGFREWLAHRYGRIEALNNEMGSAFASFDAIDPPSKDIRHQLLNTFFDHVDAYAAGQIPVYGWINDARNRALTVTVLLDGTVRGTATTALNRTDVVEALPALKSPNVGFRFDLDFRSIPVGIHVLEVMVSADGAKPLRLAKRNLALVDRKQSTPPQVSQPAGDAEPMSTDARLSGYLDGPEPNASAFYNPLARVWLEYRNQVVRNYVERFAEIAGKSCIPKKRIFSHQITPALTGSWNGDLLAVDASKSPSAFYSPGTTLYGGAAFGPAFAKMKRNLAWNRYAVNEMHPIVKLTEAQYREMFEMHRTEGAAFVAPYYLSLAPSRLRSTSALTRFRLSSDNSNYASDAFLQSIKDVMKQ